MGFQSARCLAILFSVLFLLFSCAASPIWNSSREITIMTYNVHNLFDAVSDGGEYPEYDPSGGEWTEKDYENRLANTADVIRGAVRGGPDILLCQELEHLSVLRDLLEGYLPGMGYAVYGEEERHSPGVMVGALSRFPVEKVLVHAVRMADGAAGRGIVELWITSGDSEIVLFNNHWKSKLGGAAETETQRRAEAALVAARVTEILAEDACREIVIAGDFNEQISEFEDAGCQYATAFRSGESPGDGTVPYDPCTMFVMAIPSGSDGGSDSGGSGSDGGNLVVRSPWFDVAEGGSYWFNGEWERIDHMFMTEGLFDGRGFDFGSFSVVALPFMLDENGAPQAWSKRTGTGYSDHLPLLLTIERQ